MRSLRLGAALASLGLALGCCAGDAYVPPGRGAGLAASGDGRPAAQDHQEGTDGPSGPGARGPTTTRPAARPPHFTLVATGDVLLHSQLWRQAAADAAAVGRQGHDFGPLLAGVRATVGAADLAICHLETPLAPAGGPYSSYPSFSVPPEIAPALAATGFDACSTASNHTLDRGADGVDRTLAALDAARIAHAGSARSPAEAASTTLLQTPAATVALLSYAYGFNGIPVPAGQPWRVNAIDEGRILADAATARRRGADVVVVALHWGTEYQTEPNEQQRSLAPRLIRSPYIDLLIGHHAHVVQPMESIGGEWVAYGMGNMIAYQGSLGPTREEGLLVRFTFTDTPAGWRATSAEYEPLLTSRDRTPVRLVEVGPMLTDRGTDPVFRQRLQQAWDRTSAVVARWGAVQDGLRPLAA